MTISENRKLKLRRKNPLQLIHSFLRLPIPSKKKLVTLLQQMYAHEQVPLQQKTQIVFCSDARMKTLNKKFRAKNRPTDVLSFTFNEPDLLGEIYLSLQRAKVQAKKFGLTYDEEIARLIIHGFFHLVGYDHQTTKERTVMEEKEKNFYLI